MLNRWRLAARALKRQAYVLRFACSDRRAPWYARACGVLVLAYALSPIDLIPDFIPVLGYLDDLLLIPLGMALTIWLLPENVLEDARRKADQALDRKGASSRLGVVMVVATWLLLAVILALAIRRWAF